VDTSLERFTLVQSVEMEDIYSATDLALGTCQLSKIKMWDGKDFSSAHLIANVIEYLPTTHNLHQIHRMVSRVKAEEEIWNKVTDEIFSLDALVERDKELMQYSRFVKDVFGIKFAVDSIEGCFALQKAIERISFRRLEDELSQEIKFIEVKDYLSIDKSKRSGWEAIKSVVEWGGKLFELQIQPLNNFLLEREATTRESHAGFKRTRESVRDEVAKKIPLFSYIRELLRWAFLDANQVQPECKGVEVKFLK